MFHVLLLCLTSVWPGRTQSVPNLKSISIASNYPRETYCMPSKVATWRLQPCWDMRPQEHCPPNEQSTKHILHAFNKCAIGNGHCLLRAILRSIKDQIIKPLASCVDDHPESNGLVGASGVSWIEWLCLVSLLLNDFRNWPDPAQTNPLMPRLASSECRTPFPADPAIGGNKKKCARGPNWQPHEYFLAFNQDSLKKKTSGIYLMKTTFEVWVMFVCELVMKWKITYEKRKMHGVLNIST